MEIRTANEIIPDTATHPGEVLHEELLERGISQREIARRIGRPYGAVHEIIHGKKRVTAATALDLEAVLSIPASFWLNLQARYDLVTEVNARRGRRAS